jgi:hypothetical protein
LFGVMLRTCSKSDAEGGPLWRACGMIA